MASTAPPTDGFDIAPSWVSVDEPLSDKAEKPAAVPVAPTRTKKRKAKECPEDYYPLSDTIRLYAGWLLAWYFLIYTFGSYQFTRSLPWKLSLIDDLFFSPLILHFASAAFMYLLLTSVHRILGRKTLVGAGLFVIGVGIYWMFRMYA